VFGKKGDNVEEAIHDIMILEGVIPEIAVQ
jgi:hypothetical protein